uniref:Uncharacterized protein n=1 Tax=Rhabditophanes sp. KR3021 TaxID=114890 RepID=A0AC35UBB5_9BILA
MDFPMIDADVDEIEEVVEKQEEALVSKGKYKEMRERYEGRLVDIKSEYKCLEIPLIGFQRETGDKICLSRTNLDTVKDQIDISKCNEKGKLPRFFKICTIMQNATVDKDKWIHDCDGLCFCKYHQLYPHIEDQCTLEHVKMIMDVHWNDKDIQKFFLSPAEVKLFLMEQRNLIQHFEVVNKMFDAMVNKQVTDL